MEEDFDSGTRDLDGSWIPETPQAKIRNRLSPFWVLSEMVSNEEFLKKLLETDKGREHIKSLADRCEHNKTVILSLINDTENKVE